MTPDEETRSIQVAKSELEQEFAALPPAVVDETVDITYARFEHARVRDFLPLLIRRAARTELHEREHGQPATVIVDEADTQADNEADDDGPGPVYTEADTLDTYFY